MTSPWNLQKPEEIEQSTGRLVHEFVQCLVPDKRLTVKCNFDKSSNPHRSRSGIGANRPIRTEAYNNFIELSVCPEDLLGITAVALQGWLEMEVARAVVLSEPDACRFSFQKQIQPLMRLAGSNLYYIRELVEYLSRSLIRREATKMLTEMNRGLPQVHYYFYTAIPTPEEKTFYAKYAPHNWMRASHLCCKLSEYMGLSYLADHGIGFSRALCHDWIKQHAYLPDDQAFLDKMVTKANNFAEQTFSVQLIEMFKLLRDSMLLRNIHYDIPPESGINN